MTKERLAAFSEGVLSIMVLKLKVPHGSSLQSLKTLLPVFLSYVLSFVNITIY